MGINELRYDLLNPSHASTDLTYFDFTYID